MKTYKHFLVCSIISKSDGYDCFLHSLAGEYELLSPPAPTATYVPSLIKCVDFSGICNQLNTPH